MNFKYIYIYILFQNAIKKYSEQIHEIQKMYILFFTKYNWKKKF